MSSSGLGFIIAIIFVCVAAVWTSPNKPLQFLDPHGLFIVLVGTAVITVIAIPWEFAKRFFFMVKSVCFKVPDNSVVVVQQLVEMADKARVDVNSLKDFANKVSDQFLKDAILVFLDGFEATDIELILRRRIEVQKERENSDAKMFKNLGKYPPATGLVGTVLGMIALLGSLGGEGAEEMVGPAMSVAMCATLYGVILANFLILPVSDNLLFRTQKTIAKREMIIEGILLIKQKTNPVKVREILLSHLSPTQRIEFGGNKRGSGAKAA